MSTTNNLYYVYMLTNRTHRVLYIGVTNNLERRLYEHRQGLMPGFTKKYRCHKLVWLEESNSIEDAIRREKQLNPLILIGLSLPHTNIILSATPLIIVSLSFIVSPPCH